MGGEGEGGREGFGLLMCLLTARFVWNFCCVCVGEIKGYFGSFFLCFYDSA